MLQPRLLTSDAAIGNELQARYCFMQHTLHTTIVIVPEIVNRRKAARDRD